MERKCRGSAWTCAQETGVDKQVRLKEFDGEKMSGSAVLEPGSVLRKLVVVRK